MNVLDNVDDNYNTRHAQHSSTILVVDDNIDILRLTKRSLREHGFKVSAFTDPTIALEDFKLNWKDCDLIVSDTMMPRMNGYEFIKKAKEIDKHIKIVLMSSLEINDKEFHNILQGIKIDAFLQKPFSMTKLNDLIEKINTKE